MNPAIKLTADPSQDVLQNKAHPLDVFFTPRSVAVIGATETPDSVGRTLLQNLVYTPFGGPVYPVNPKRKSVLGIKAYPSINDVPDQVDLAVIITPAKTVPGIIHQCVDSGVKGAIIISAGFKEIGPAGVELERQVMEEANRGNMRIIGPNCLGAMCPPTGLNASFAKGMGHTGNLAFISQSGALGTAVLDWSLREQVGFSAFISIGSMLDVNWGDLISYLGSDPHTRSIVIYMESIGDARSFLSAAREVALTKPIIVIKAGRTAMGASAAASHTGSLAGSDDVLEAAFRRTGVLRVNDIADLFYMAEILAKQPKPQGPRLTIITNAGGPGVLATDSLIAHGGELARLDPGTIEQLNECMPPQWSHGNPVDVLGDAAPERYSKALEIASKDPNSDGMLVILTPQSVTNPTTTAEMLKPYAQTPGKPVLAAWMGGSMVTAGTEILRAANIPVFPYPDAASKAFDYMWQYSYNLKSLYETPSLAEDTVDNAAGRQKAAAIVDKARLSGRTILTEFESKEVLSAYDIPTIPTEIATSPDEAVKQADKMGYPVVLKLLSETITHKTDVGGVQLNLNSAEAVRKAYAAIETSVNEKTGPGNFLGVTVQLMFKREGYEIIIGSSVDPQFGPVLLFGMGGQLVEVFKDKSLALPPLNSTLARRMMEQTKIYKALKGVRGRKPVDLAALEQIMVRFSQLVVEQPWIKEIDINPLLAGPDGIVALDARVLAYGADITKEMLPKLAIRPYPTQYIGEMKTKDGNQILVRPIRPEDEPAMVVFHEHLSEQSVYSRYFSSMTLSQRTRHERLTRICYIDYDRQMALVAVGTNPSSGEQEILGVGRLIKTHGTNSAEFAIVVADPFQRKGLGTELLSRLMVVAREEKLSSVSADILQQNVAMQRIAERLGFTLTQTDDNMVRAERSL